MSQETTDESGRGPLGKQIILAYLKAVEEGQKPDPNDILARYPDLAAELGVFFASQEQQRHVVAAPQAAVPVEHTAQAVAQAFGDYEALEEIARGGMGVVYRAHQVSLNRTVALKMIRDTELASPEEVRRLRFEATHLAQLDHPNIVPIYEVGEHAGLPYISMKWIPGNDLRRDIPYFARNPRAAAQLIVQVARALQHAHQRGVLHRDLKPANILLDAAKQPHVTDFSLAKQIRGGPTITQSGAIVGTPSYMAPEQARGQRLQSPAADIYGLCAVLYELLTGRPPLEGPSPIDIMLKVLKEDPVPPRKLNAHVPRDLETICLKGLNKEPSRRYVSADALADDLQRFLEGRAIKARPLGSFGRAWRWWRRNRGVGRFASAAAILTTLILTIAVSQRKGLEERRHDTFRLAQAASDAGRQAEAVAILKEVPREFRGPEWLVVANRLADAAYKAGRNEQALAVLEEIPDEFRRWEWRFRARCFGGKGVLTRLKDGNAVYGVFSPDCQRVAIARADRSPAQVDILDADTGKELLTFRADNRSKPMDCVAFSPDGQRLASASAGGMVEVWDGRSGQTLLTLQAQTGPVEGVAFSPDGQRLASAGSDKTVKVWDGRSGKTLLTLQGHTDRVWCVAFSPDGQRLSR
jgi:tRNA A-37 threonylcarbamoyl transferase component Bud32